ncbi:MAG: PD-(D/E)XK nuclease family protein, partial [bacterium]
YVAMTRARHTLVLVDDADLFPESKSSFAVCLPQLKEIKNDELVPSLKKVSPEKTFFSEIKPERALSLQDWERARNVPFIRRELPHHLAEKRWAESFEQNASFFEKTSLPSTRQRDERALALAYGVWWHYLCETMPWPDGEGAWKKHFEKAQADSPLPERARLEWDNFLRSELAQLFAPPDLLFHTEMPILHPVEEQRCIDGVVDLAIWNARKQAWLVVDWKTDSATPKTARNLWDIYQPQLQAYKNALQNVSGFPTQVGIYSTMTGLFLH